MTKINKTHKLKEYSMLIMDSVKKWSTPFYLVNNLLFGPQWKEKKVSQQVSTSLFQTLSSALSLTPRHDVQSVIDYADKTMTTRTPTVNFDGLSLTFKEKSKRNKVFGCAFVSNYKNFNIWKYKNIYYAGTQISSLAIEYLCEKENIWQMSFRDPWVWVVWSNKNEIL